MSSRSFDFLLAPVAPATFPCKGVSLVDGLAFVNLMVAVVEAVDVSAVAPCFWLAFITCNFVCHISIMPCKQLDNNLSQASIAGSPC
jgi:hypothetical protein